MSDWGWRDNLTQIAALSAQCLTLEIVGSTRQEADDVKCGSGVG